MLALAGVLAACIALSGCLGTTPEPTPTPTAAFASEEEAFAAAEETYRAYVAASNARRADPLSDPDPQSFLVGEALEADLESLREFDELGIHLEGTTRIAAIERVTADPRTGDVEIEACYDVTDSRVVNEAGVDVTIADRDPTILLSVHLAHVDDEIAIERMSAVEGGAC